MGVLTVIGILGMVLAYFSAGAGHGTYVPAKVLFPVTMLSAVAVGSITGPCEQIRIPDGVR